MASLPLPLPDDYVAALQDLSLRAAWLALRTLTPPQRPIRTLGPMHWRYDKVRPLLMRAGEIVPMEQAERRVLALQNPGAVQSRLATTPSIFLGLQLILPGERAPAHRHTPAAARLVVEGSGGYTIVNGAKLSMEAGDLLLTPSHCWHEHRHDGPTPMIWLDLLDHPVGIPLETSYIVEEHNPDSGYVPPTDVPDPSETIYTEAGLVPYRSPAEPAKRYPMMRFPWARTRAALEVYANNVPATVPVHLMYVNPETGDSLLKTLSFSARMLRPGECLHISRRSPSSVFHVIDGIGEIDIDGTSTAWGSKDTIAIPTFAEVRLENTSQEKPAFLIQADDGPLQHKLGFFEDEKFRPALSVEGYL